MTQPSSSKPLLVIDDDYLFYALAIRSVTGIGVRKAKRILDKQAKPKNIFSCDAQTLMSEYHLSEQNALDILAFKDFKKIEKEIDFIKKRGLEVVFYHENDYPPHLQQIPDAPVCLFATARPKLQDRKVITIVGTRKHTEYGKKITEQIISELAPLNVVILSGLALGIDSIAHTAALRHQLETIAILGNGLSMIYPTANESLATQMMLHKGLLMTEFFSTVQPSRDTFPIRNRIVAGMSDAVIVIETKKKGGSMITANLANEYNKDVFAVPGRLGDEYSEGCHQLIYTNRAFLFTNTKDFIQMMNWEERTNEVKEHSKEPSLPSEQSKQIHNLSERQQKIMNILSTQKEKTHLDVLITESELSFSELSAELLDLEFKDFIRSLPGKFFIKST